MGLWYREHQKYEMTWLKQYPHQKPVLITARHIQTYCHSLTCPFAPLQHVVITHTVYNIVVWLHSGKHVLRFTKTSRRWGSKSTWIRNWLVTLGVRRPGWHSCVCDLCFFNRMLHHIICWTHPEMTQTALNCRHINTWCVSLYSHMWRQGLRQNIRFWRVWEQTAKYRAKNKKKCHAVSDFSITALHCVDADVQKGSL